MTKEERIEFAKAIEYSVLKQGYIGLWRLIDDFFSQNVVIPKGENRHPYADVLHEWIEDISLTLESKDCKGNWDKSLVNNEVLNGHEYRIKPQEPVYEWQWYTVYDGLTHLDNRFFTLQEMINFGHDKEWKPIEETKRVRQ